MNYTNIIIPGGDYDAELVCDLALELGAQSSTIIPNPDSLNIFDEPGEVHLERMQDISIKILITEDLAIDRFLKNLQIIMNLQNPFPFKTETVENRDWVWEGQRHFTPINISNKFWIVPSWMKPASYPDPKIQLDPGVAFGTGTHPTTRVCLEWLTTLSLGGKRVLDYGCGSGILGIAAAKMDAYRIVGVDIDRQTLSATQRNAALNQVSVETYFPNELPQEQFDIIVANILAKPLIELTTVLIEKLAPQGVLGLSGILRKQEQSVRDAYESKVVFSPTIILDDWCFLSGMNLN